jgi:hypothetical protein
VVPLAGNGVELWTGRPKFRQSGLRHFIHSCRSDAIDSRLSAATRPPCHNFSLKFVAVCLSRVSMKGSLPRLESLKRCSGKFSFDHLTLS